MVTKLKDCGRNVKVLRRERERTAPTIRLDKNHYARRGDAQGVVRECRHRENRAEDFNSVRQSMRRLRDIISRNVTDDGRCMFLTLTYAENMTDPQRLQEDFEDFIRTARRNLKAFGKLEYISVIEPQERGAWHIHAVLIFDRKAPSAECFKPDKWWGKGRTSIKTINDGDNLAMYLTKAATKKYQHLLPRYPAGMRIYRTSRGVVKPEYKAVTADEAAALIGDRRLVYEGNKVVADKNGEVLDSSRIEVYSDCSASAEPVRESMVITLDGLGTD